MPIRILREESAVHFGSILRALERSLCPIVMPFCAYKAVVQKRFGIHPLVEGPGRPVHPKTTTFCPVLGFTPSTQPSRAHQSQNDLEQGSPAAKIAKPHTLNCHSGSSSSQNGTPQCPKGTKLNPDLGLHFPKQVKGLQRGEVVQVGGGELLAK